MINCAEDRLATVESGTAHAPPSKWVSLRYACQGQLPFLSTLYSSLQTLQKLMPCLHWYDLAKSFELEASHGWKLDCSRKLETGTPYAVRTYPIKAQIKHRAWRSVEGPVTRRPRRRANNVSHVALAITVPE